MLQVSPEGAKTCVLTSTNDVRCWGDGSEGLLGYGNTTSIGDDELPWTAGNVPLNVKVAYIASGRLHTCVLTVDDTVHCWGDGSRGQLGYGNTDTIGDDEPASSVGPVNIGEPVAQLSAGPIHNCVLTASGKVRCWGEGMFGQLGYGNVDRIGDSEEPVDAGDLEIFDSPLPVELTAFTATLAGSTARLAWTTATETTNAGFEVQRILERNGQEFWDVLGFVPGAGSTAEAQAYAFDVDDLEPGRHGFRLKQIDFDGQFEFSETIEVFVGIPGTHVLEAAYPNPFNPRTTFAFLVAETQPVRATLHDAQGRLIRVLHDAEVQANEKVWVRVNAADLASGTYLYRIEGQNFSETKQVQLVR
ncbi:MAG: T9SS type A sorting domain-containing protein [Bacteroidota bacterium]